MIGLDTNVLVRLLVEDDRRQSGRAAGVLREACTAESPGYVNHIVLCELVWVLQARYRFGRAAIAGTVKALSQSSDVRLENPAAVRRALDSFVAGSADFADCLVGILNREAGCGTTLTFDRAAAALPDFKLA